MSLRRRSRVWLCVVGAAGQLACAGLGLRSGDRAANDVEIRPDAPPEYDLLVAQQHMLDGEAAEGLAAYQRAVAKDETSAFLHRRVAAALAQQSRLDEATVHAQRALELEPGDPETRLFLGQLYRLRHDLPAAETTLRTESGEPVDADAAFLLYQVYLEAGRLDEAATTAQWLVVHEPDELRGRFALATVYQRQGKLPEADRTLRDALKVDPGNLRVYGMLARSMRERGDREGEIRIYREVLGLDPDHLPTLIALGESQMDGNDLEGAIATFEEIERRFPEDMRSVVRLGFLKYEARDFAGAASRFERASAADPQEYEYVFFLAVARRRMGDSERAIESFRSIPPEHKHYPEARTQIASILERRGDFQGALAEVELAVAASPPSRPLDLYKATLRAKTGDFAGAEADLKRLLAQEPEDDELLYSIGMLYGEAKRTDEAIQYMRLALERNPDNASALNFIGYTWAEKGINLDEAERMIARAVELRPDDGYIVDSLGWVHYVRARALVGQGRSQDAQKHLDAALEYLERADRLTGGDPVVSEHLGDTYLLLDQKRRALDRFEEAIRLEPRENEQPELMHKFENLKRELR
ncbi:MAG TPA: tetratricopeptide repeat protein [Myxococcota bacterium]